jgi:hypothetical protein
MDRQVQAGPTDHGVDVRHDDPRLKAVPRARLSQEGARLRRQGREGPYPSVRARKSSGASVIKPSSVFKFVKLDPLRKVCKPCHSEIGAG